MRLMPNIVQANGGTVVPLENRADILIADHAKPKFAPPGSYSWKFIEDSVKNGFIQIKDRYLIGLDPDVPRPAGGGGGGLRTTRTPFTDADDAVVAKWVLSRSNRTGNKIFQDLEMVVSSLLRVESLHDADSCRTADTLGSHGGIVSSSTCNDSRWKRCSI
jgi:hypothetical protein